MASSIWNKLDEALSIVQTAASIAEMYPVAAAPALLASKLIAIAQATVQAHENVTGKPIDVTLLHQIAPVVVPSETPTPAPTATVAVKP